jgi:hypothetical protein
LSNLHERPRLAWKPRLNGGLDRSDFRFVDRDWILAGSNDVRNPRDHKNWKPINWIQSAKNIALKKGLLDFFEPIRPSASARVSGQKRLVVLSTQVCRDDILVTTSDLYCIPGIDDLVRFHLRTLA